jgi:choline dehydrogenase-like flavoprotein
MDHDVDIAIVGGGIAGVCAWDLLRRGGASIALLEAGPRTPAEPVETAADDPRWRYGASGARWRRTHALGGRAHVWGGWLGAFSDGVFAHGWPVGAGDIAPAYRAAERWLGRVDHPLPDAFAELRELGADARGRAGADAPDSPWLRALDDARAQARTETIATRLVIERGRARGVEVRTAHGIETIRAGRIVLAASPVETCRLLLASGAAHPAIGEGLHDHLTASFHLLCPDAEALAPDTAAAGATLRFPPGRGAPDRGFVVEVFGPFALGPDNACHLADDGIAAPIGTPFVTIHAMGEQLPSTERYVRLDDERDQLGRRVPRLALAPTAEDHQVIEHMRAACIDVASALSVGDATLVELGNSAEHPRIFHPGGVVRMGGDDAPADERGRLREWPDVWIADASVFPTSGDCHPTLTVVAHVHRVVEHMRAAAQR